MNNYIHTALLGAAVWAGPFAACLVFAPLQVSQPRSFTALVAVSLSAVTVALFSLYVHKQNVVSAIDGVRVGVTWLLVCVLIDVPLFTAYYEWPLASYLLGIASSYLVIPIITVAMAFVSRVHLAASNE